MRLSGSSSAEQLQQWCKLIGQLHHAKNIHMLITGKATAGMFELAMQMLSQHFKDITELHLLASDHHTSSSSNEDTGPARPGPGPAATDTACITSLLPLKHLLSRLKTLVVCGVHRHVSVQDLADDLQQLGAAATSAGHCWQLQSLTLRAYWTDVIEQKAATGEDRATPVLWPCFSDAMMQMSKAFPDLQQLTVYMPPIGLRQSVITATAAGHYEGYYSEDSDAGEGAPYIRPADTLHILDDYNKDIDYTDSSIKSHAATAQVAAVAALANAALQLQKLQQLTVSELPDLWTTRKQFLWYPPTHAGRVSRRLSAIAIAKARASSAASAAAVDAVYDVGLPLTTSAAAAAFGTLDECGCWLLQQHASLTKLHINTVGHWNHTMSWQRKEPCICENDRSYSGTTDLSTAAGLLNVEVSMDWSRRNSIRRPWLPSGSSSSSNGDDDDYNESLTSHVRRQLSLYSFRPAVLTMSHVSSCRLATDELNVNGLADLLGDLKSLKHLKIIACHPKGIDWGDKEARSAQLTATVSAAMAAVAAAKSLKSLHLSAFCSNILLPDDLLLPLSCVAAGPCSGLTKLELTARFKEPAVQAGNRAGSGGDCGMKWSHALKQLKALRHLSIQDLLFGERNRFSVECLPAGLEFFKACDLGIYSEAVAAGGLAAGDAACDVAQRMAVAEAHAYPTLQQLFLDKCQLSSPSILASDQLQQLTVVDSTWSGGWAAATAAWPNVTKLYWRYNVLFSNHDDTSSEVEEAGTMQLRILNDAYTARRMLQEIAVGFKQLRSLTLEKLPCMSVEVFAKFVLQPVVQQMQDIQYLHIMSACMENHEVDELQELEGDVAAAVMKLLGDDGSSNNSSLRSVSGGSVVAALNSVQQWLQDQLPWASIAVSDVLPYIYSPTSPF